MENSIIYQQEEANKLNKILEEKDSQIRDFYKFSNKKHDPKSHFNINDLVFRFGYAGLLYLDVPKVLKPGSPCH